MKFRWRHIGLPLSLLAATVILTAVFYPMLPTEAAYRFSEGAAETVISRTALAVWLIVPCLIFTLLSYGLVRILLISSRYWDDEHNIVARVLPLLGNMTGLASIIVFFAGLQIFIYNVSDALLGPFWVLAVVVMVAGGIVIGARFFGLFRESRRHNPKPDQE